MAWNTQGLQCAGLSYWQVKPKWRMIVSQEAAMRQEKASSFLECDNGDQQLYLWCWKKAKFIWSLSRGQYWAVHRAGAGLGGQWEPQRTLRVGMLAPPSISPAWGFPPCLLDQNMTTGFLLCPSQALSGPLAFSRVRQAESLFWVRAESLHMYKVHLPVAFWPGPRSNPGRLLREPAHPLFQPSLSCSNVRFES